MSLQSNDTSFDPQATIIIKYLEEELDKVRLENAMLNEALVDSRQNALHQTVTQMDGSPPAKRPRNAQLSDGSALTNNDPTNSQQMNDESHERVIELTKQLEAAKQEVNDANKRADTAVEQLNKLQAEVVVLKSKLDANEQLNCDLTEQNDTLVQKLESGQSNRKSTNKTVSIKHCSESVVALNSQGQEKYKSKHYEDALENFLKAAGIEEVGRNNENWLGSIWNNVSACWRDLKRYGKSREAANKAISYNPSHEVHYYNRGLAYRNLGNRFKAAEDFKKALELCPSYKNAKKALDELEPEQLIQISSIVI